jgi:DNA-binding NtrC family response regulator
MAKIILLALEHDLADQLRPILRRQGHDVQAADSADSPEIRRADVLFAGGDRPDYRETVTSLTRSFPLLPLVLVNRHPENARWLDALELGAADYCGAPFEAIQIQWVLDSLGFRHPATFAAA